jgi:hypothetical protein
MKTRIALIVCLLAAVSTWAYIRVNAQSTVPSTPPHQWAASQETPYVLTPGPNGRYQLIAATIDTLSPTPEQTVIRIDSQTGKAWRLVNLADPSGIPGVVSWMPVQESDLKPN